jgi:hypothetical protein
VPAAYNGLQAWESRRLERGGVAAHHHLQRDAIGRALAISRARWSWARGGDPAAEAPTRWPRTMGAPRRCCGSAPRSWAGRRPGPPRTCSPDGARSVRKRGVRRPGSSGEVEVAAAGLAVTVTAYVRNHEIAHGYSPLQIESFTIIFSISTYILCYDWFLLSEMEILVYLGV